MIVGKSAVRPVEWDMVPTVYGDIARYCGQIGKATALTRPFNRATHRLVIWVDGVNVGI